jgi:S-DNA-T family DNA segregation ATPase FtsK/SpoIIIE
VRPLSSALAEPVEPVLAPPPPPPIVRVARREPPAGAAPAPVPTPAADPQQAPTETLAATAGPAAVAPPPPPLLDPPPAAADDDPADPPPAPRETQLLLPVFDALPDAGGAADDTYTLPPLSMLTPAEAGPVEEYETAMREKAEILGRTLQNFRIEARVVAVERGPNITQYELELAAGVKVHRIMSLGDDLAMALKAPSIRIIAPIPGKSTVGIEVPNQDQDVVRLRELIESDEFGRKDFALPLFLGKDSTGNPLIADLARMPHLLIAGATGSGKSVCMNTIILSILLARKPAQVKMILIDPKMVELSLYEHIPHLLAPVVTDMRKAPSVLEWAVNKMEERYGLLSRVEVRHIKNYNALGAAEIAARLEKEEADLEKEKIPTHLPYIVVVIDEFADLMCVARKEVEGSIIRLAQKSRAVGIHLILATQRPTADVITGLIKSNMPCRIAFQVASKVDSRTIIDKNGAEMLVGQGDMLFLPPGSANVIRAQGTYVSEDEVKAVVKFCKAAAQPEFHPELVRWEGGEAGGGEGGEEDELYDQAVRIVLETQRGSASLLQRRLEIGYSRASRLIDIMTERGILGPFKGSKAREILLSLEDWEAMKARERGEEV